MDEGDELERRFMGLGGTLLNSTRGGQEGDLPIMVEPSLVMAEPYSCIIFTPEEADKWYSSEGGRRELLDGEDFFRKQRDYFGFNFPGEIMTLTPVKKLFQQYYLNSKSESDKQIIKEAMERESGGASAGMPRAQGGGLKKKKRRKSKKKKSKTRRRRR